MFNKIIDIRNIENAYLDLYRRLLEKNGINKYSGLDNVTISSTEPHLKEILKKAREELINSADFRPAKYVSIAKTNGKMREIYIMPIVERIKQQAIYRTIEPLIEKKLSFFLYSFRTTHPTYYALKSAVRFYLKNYGKNFYVYKTDFKDYSNYIDQSVLLEKLEKIIDDKRVLALLKQTLEYPYAKKGEILSMKKGILQGMPLNCLFVNYYMHELDHQISKKVDFYRRVGDDILIYHNNKNDLVKISKELKKATKEARLEINEEKSLLQPMEMPFGFLGLHFENSKISLPEEKVSKFFTQLKGKLKPSKNRLNTLQKALQIKNNGQSHVLFNYLFVHNLVNDFDQIKAISNRLQNLIYAYLGGGYSFRKMQNGRKFLSKIQFNSFYKHYLKIVRK
jgi:RNA-directed DNA polymerase